MSVNIKTLKATAEALEIAIPIGTKVDQVVQVIKNYYLENYEMSSLMNCDTCQNPSPEYDADGELAKDCPYCGVSFDGDEISDADSGDPEVPEDPEVPAKVKKGKKGKKEDATPTEKKKPGRKKKESTEIAPVEEQYIVTEEQRAALNESVEKIRHLQLTRAEATYQIGIELNRLNEQNLWKGITRSITDADGNKTEKPYASFAEFVKISFDISRSGAFKYMRCARSFDESEYQVIGVRSCDLILSAPEAMQDSLKSAALDGAPFVELKGIIKRHEGTPNRTSEADEPKHNVSLLSRSKEGDIILPWLNPKTLTPVIRGNSKEKFARLDLTNDYEIVIFPGVSGLDVTVRVVMIEKVGNGATPGMKIGNEEPSPEVPSE